MNGEINNFNQEKNVENKRGFLIIGFGVILIIVAIGYALFGNSFSKSNEESNVESTSEETKVLATDIIKEMVNGIGNDTRELITIESPEGAECTNTFAYDGTTDNNLRYVGNDPCNYVTFNNELWQIVGVMNNIDNGTGEKESRLKIVRKDSLGDYSWDTSDSNVQAGLGVNDWTQADLMTELSRDYLNTTLSKNTMWYNDTNNTKNEAYDFTKSLNSDSQNLIENTKWNLGIFDANGDLTVDEIYEYERNYKTMQNNTSTSTSWTGKVALLHISDLGFSVGGYGRDECLNKEPFYSQKNDRSCILNSWIPSGWLLNSSSRETVSAISNSDDGTFYDYVSTAMEIHPAVYLKSNVTITGGDGSLSNPYTLSL